MDNTTQLGLNRTGMQMSPLNGTGMADFSRELAGDAPTDQGEFQKMHQRYVEEADALGSVPVPGTVKGILKTGTSKLMGIKPEVLVDKLGERLAFERGGTRLYEAMIMKVTSLQSMGTLDGSRSNGSSGGSAAASDAVGGRVELATLKRIHGEELAHFHLVKDALVELGADPTAMTPCADVVGVQAMGLIQTVSDPRTTVAQSLNALLSAELTDHAGWELLMELAEELGQDEMAVRFSVAATTEAEHMTIVKEWLRTEILVDAT